MRRNEDRDRGERDRDRGDRDKAGGSGERRTFQKRKGCRFCTETGIAIDYKDRYGLVPFVTERMKIVPRRISGNCSSHQREMTRAIKRARHLAIISYTSAQV